MWILLLAGEVVDSSHSGNHDLTLDAAWYEKNSSMRKWPRPQDPVENRKLFTESTSITYLENETAEICLNAKNGPRTCFKVYGSPCVPNNRNWGFAYKPGTAKELWGAIPEDTDIVVTHTPPRGHLDVAPQDERTGCEDLLGALHRVRPMLSVFGHIHDSRGVEKVRWNLQSSGNGSLTEGVEAWDDPGKGKKQSMVDLTTKGGHPLLNVGRLTRQTFNSGHLTQGEPLGGGVAGVIQPYDVGTTSPSKGVAGEVRGRAKVMVGGAIEYRQGSGVGVGHQPDVADEQRKETVMINCAFLGPHHMKTTFNKPIVVDVDLPIWDMTVGAE